MNVHLRGPSPGKNGMAKLIVRTHLQNGRWHRGKLILDFARDRGIGHGTVDAVATALGVERRIAAKWG